MLRVAVQARSCKQHASLRERIRQQLIKLCELSQEQEKKVLAEEKAALEREKRALTEQLAALEAQLSTPAKRSRASDAAAGPSPLASAVLRAADAEVNKQQGTPLRVTSTSIIGVSDQVQAALDGLRGSLRAASERLGMQDATEPAVDELRSLCLLLRRQLVKTVGPRAVGMEATLRSVLDWAQDAQVRNSRSVAGEHLCTQSRCDSASSTYPLWSIGCHLACWTGLKHAAIFWKAACCAELARGAAGGRA